MEKRIAIKTLRTQVPHLHPAVVFSQAFEAPSRMLPQLFYAPGLLFNTTIRLTCVVCESNLQPVGNIIVDLCDQGDTVLKDCNGLLRWHGSLRIGMSVMSSESSGVRQSRLTRKLGYSVRRESILASSRLHPTVRL